MQLKSILFLGLLSSAVCAQEYGLERVRVIGGSAWSFIEGDEYLHVGIQVPVAKKTHVGFILGYRPRANRTLQGGVSFAYSLLTSGPHRLYVKTDLSGFIRLEGFIYDDRFVRNSFGFGYLTQLYKRCLLYAEVSPIGFYYGTRKDTYRGPSDFSIWDAGEFKLGFGYRF